jgi:hypothetical protein
MRYWRVAALLVELRREHEALGDAQERICVAVARLSEAQLDEPFPEAEYRYVFPTVRHAMVQVLVGHTAYHVGQAAVWRKAMGMAAIGRSYE